MQTKETHSKKFEPSELSPIIDPQLKLHRFCSCRKIPTDIKEKEINNNKKGEKLISTEQSICLDNKTCPYFSNNL